MDCEYDATNYPTSMDGIIGWNCKQWRGCNGGADIVHCTGYFGHNYPFWYRRHPYIEGTRIMWEFMKTHKRNNSLVRRQKNGK